MAVNGARRHLAVHHRPACLQLERGLAGVEPVRARNLRDIAVKHGQELLHLRAAVQLIAAVPSHHARAALDPARIALALLAHELQQLLVQRLMAGDVEPPYRRRKPVRAHA